MFGVRACLVCNPDEFDRRRSWASEYALENATPLMLPKLIRGGQVGFFLVAVAKEGGEGEDEVDQEHVLGACAVTEYGVAVCKPLDPMGAEMLGVKMKELVLTHRSHDEPMRGGLLDRRQLEFNGPESCVVQLMDVWERQHVHAEMKRGFGMKCGVFSLMKVAKGVSDGVGGQLRLAKMEEKELLTEWMKEFTLCVFASQPGSHMVALANDKEEMVKSVIQRVSDGTLFVWEDDGRPVSLVGWRPLGEFARVGPVFTPEALRCRGYGRAAVGGVCEHALKRVGCVSLLADADYAPSNRCYSRVGFELLGERFFLQSFEVSG